MNPKNAYIVAPLLVLSIGFFALSFIMHTKGGSLSGRDASADPTPVVSPLGAAEEDESTWVAYESSFGFSFRHPADFSVDALPAKDAGETTILLKGDPRKSSARNRDIQIFIRPIGESGPVTVTADDIKADNPGIVIADPQPVQIGAASGAGLAFIAGADGETKTREIWFAYGGRLYQISTYSTNDDLMSKVMNTWQFGK